MVVISAMLKKASLLLEFIKSPRLTNQERSFMNFIY